MTEESDKLTDSLVGVGIDADLAPLVAKGLVAELQEWCWANLTDIVGRVADVDRILDRIIDHSPLTLKGGVLAPMLMAAGILAVDKGRFYLPSAWTERPVYISQRWLRASLPKRRFARDRPRKRRPRRRTQKARATALEKEIRTYWCQRWSVIIGGGEPYPFDLVDARCLRKLISASRDMDHAKSIIDAYFQSRRNHFYAGKPLSKLVCDLGPYRE